MWLCLFGTVQQSVLSWRNVSQRDSKIVFNRLDLYLCLCCAYSRKCSYVQIQYSIWWHRITRNLWHVVLSHLLDAERKLSQRFNSKFVSTCSRTPWPRRPPGVRGPQAENVSSIDILLQSYYFCYIPFVIYITLIQSESLLAMLSTFLNL